MFPVERVPERIGSYSVQKYVGRIGASDVYVARMDGPMGFQRTVTLKVVPLSLEDDPRFAEELGREATICSKLSHQAVARMYDFFEHEGRLVLVLEQVEGATLEKLVQYLGRRKGKLSDAAILYIGAEVASALAHGHTFLDENGSLSPVIHRNIQPENIWVTWDGRVRLSGFGQGKILGRTADSVAGTVSGAPGYMSPEQARGERATVRSDVYSLGVVLWSLFTDQDPPGKNEPLKSLRDLRPDLPKEISAAIDEATNRSPDSRKITAGDLRRWIEKLSNVEAGREDLRQKVATLRSARDVVDAPRAAPRPTKKATRRRQTLGSARSSLRRSAAVASSFPPSSRGKSNRARPITSAESLAPDSDPPTLLKEDQQFGVVPGIPRPPALPSKAPTFGPRPQPLKPSSAWPTSKSTGPAASARPSSMRPGSVGPAAGSTRPSSTHPSSTHPSSTHPSSTHPSSTHPSTRPSSMPPRGPHDDPPSRSRAWEPLFKPLQEEDGGIDTRATVRPPNIDFEFPPAPPPDESTAIRAMSAIPADLVAETRRRAEETNGTGLKNFTTTGGYRRPVFGPRPVAVANFAATALAGEEGVPTPREIDLSLEQDKAPRKSILPGARAMAAAIDTRGMLGRETDPNDEARTTKGYRVRAGGSRKSNGLAQVLLAATTAGIVVVVGMLIIQKVQAPSAAVASSPEKTENTSNNSDSETKKERAPEAPPPRAPSRPSNPDTEHAAENKHVDSQPVDLSRLSDQLGYLTVKSSAHADVYVNGILKGPTNEPLVVPCGQWFLRLAAPSPGRFPTWLGKGETVVVPCRTSTTIDVNVPPDPPAPPGRTGSNGSVL